jgi:multiple sugar transport system substrate-binding protein
MTRRRFLGRAAATGLGLSGMAALLAACGGSTPASGTASTGSSSSGGKVTLQFLTLNGTPEQPMYQGLLDQFMKQNPNIEVKMVNVANGSIGIQQKLLVMLAGGTPPDVFWTHTYITPGLVSIGAVLALDSLISQSSYNTGAFLKPALDDFHVAGHQYALPRETTAFVLWYNKDLLTKAGAPLPQPDWKWADLIAAAEKVQSAQNYGITYMTNDIYMETIKTWQNGGDILNADRTQYTLDQKPGTDAASFIQDMIWKQKIHPTPDTAKNVDLFGTGKAAFQPEFSVFESVKNAPFAWDVAPIPTDGKRVTRVASAGHSICSKTQHPEEAWKLLQFLESETAFNTYVSNGVTMPSLTSVFNNAIAHPGGNIVLPKSVSVIQDAFGYGRPEPIAGNWVAVHQTIDSACLNVWGPQQESATQALSGIASNINQLITQKP